MAFNGVGIFESLAPPYFPAVAGEIIFSEYFNLNMNDLFNGLSNCVTRDGQSPPTANLPMGGFKHQGCADAVLDDEYVTLGQLGTAFVDEAADYTWTGSHTWLAGNSVDPAILVPPYPTTRIARTSPVGGLGEIRSPFIIDHKVDALTTAFEWSFLARNSNYAGDAGENVAGYFQGYKYAVDGNMFGLVSEVQDYSGNSGAGILCALELDICANGSAGVASRVGTQYVFKKANAGLATMTARAAIEFAPFGDDKTQASLSNLMDSRLNVSGALIRQSNTSSAGYAMDFLNGAGLGKFIRFYSGAMPAFQLVGSGGTLGTYVGRFLIDIDGFTYWFPIYG